MAKICNKRLLCFQLQKPGHAPILVAGIDSIPFVASDAAAKIGALTASPLSQSILLQLTTLKSAIKRLFDAFGCTGGADG
jgi:hypothetical protein